MLTTKAVRLVEESDEVSRVAFGSCLLESCGDYEFMRLLYVPVNYRRVGVASRIVSECKRVCNGHGLIVEPEPWADEPMDTEQLRAWYARMGFVPHSSQPQFMCWHKS